MKIEESVREDNIMRLTLLIDEGHEYLKEKDKNDNYWKWLLIKLIIFIQNPVAMDGCGLQIYWTTSENTY